VRRLDDLARLMDIAKKHNVLVATVSGDLDLTTAQGRAAATLFGALASIEVDATSERIRDRKPAGPADQRRLRQYGWTVDRTEHVEKEADVIREVATRLIDGEALTSVCRDLNRRGIPTAGAQALGRLQAA